MAPSRVLRWLGTMSLLSAVMLFTAMPTSMAPAVRSSTELSRVLIRRMDHPAGAGDQVAGTSSGTTSKAKQRASDAQPDVESPFLVVNPEEQEM